MNARLSRGVVALSLLAASLSAGPVAAAVCEDWIATAVSVQGSVQARTAGESQWVRVRLNDTYCVGDTIRVDARSRAALALRNGAILRLDQNTALTFSPPTTAERAWIDLLTGVVHFFSRVVRSLNVRTPFVNAAVEGTEFWMEVGADQAVVTVLEGRIAAANAAGALSVGSGQSAIAKAGQAPTLRPILVRPTDAVQWALHYPPLIEYRSTDFPDRPGETWQALVRRALEASVRGDFETAFANLAGVPENVGDARFFVYRAGLLLSVGRVDEAIPDIERALNLDPRNSPAVALQAVVAVAKNDKAEALRLARRAVELDANSVTARLALSYAQQASFDLEEALGSLQSAVALQPDSGLARARLAELWLSFRELGKALEAAREAARLSPDLARTQTVLGFAYLARIETRRAAAAFERAIQLDQADPLPRLGLGLARIRDGDLEAGRREMEIAVSLDPGSSLLRSYLGKAYYEEKRDRQATDQLALAKGLDPQDPTPWFYDAIRKQSVNRPVEALQDLQRSIELNDNRAVYRSRLLLDEDLAARNASLARIYDNLGFQQLALLQGWRSLNADPSNYSAHRFLADSYSVLPRHEIARVSELLQSQLLQPLNINPVQPQLGLSNSFFLAGTGPANPSFNEFNPLFERNRLSLWASGVAGGNDTFGDELVVSGLWNQFSLSVGQFHYETDGFRANNDLRQDVYNVFAQARLAPSTSVQLEFRSTDRRRGDLALRFDPGNFSPTLRQSDQVDSLRLGVRHAFDPASILLLSAAYQNAEFETTVFPGFRLITEEDSYSGELQHLWRTRWFDLISGGGHSTIDRTDRFPRVPVAETTVDHTNVYLYAHVQYPKDLTITVGGAGDFLTGGIVDRRQFNPKFGVIWTPLPSTTLRAAVFRTLKRALISDQTIEPTQVAGFNQFFDDPEGTDAWRYGIGIDQALSRQLHVGAEFSRRDLQVPTQVIGPPTRVRETDHHEELGRAYLYWAPRPWVALGVEYLYERLKRDPEALNPEQVAESRTHRLPLTLTYFHPSGLLAQLKGTYVNQRGRFGDAAGGVVSGDDQFFVVDASLGYRLPNRWGLITLEAKNLFDQRFRFQDTDSSNPTLAPERLVLVRFTLAY